VMARSGGVWPSVLAPLSHGLCGDPKQGMPNPAGFMDESYLVGTGPQKTYSSGSIVEFRIAVTAHHQGHYEFRVCNRTLDTVNFASAAEGQACLNSVVLERAAPLSDCVVNDPRGDCQPLDTRHPERWYLPPPASASTVVADDNWDDAQANPLPASSDLHVMRYKIPADLHCEACTLQWYWSTGNSCFYDGDYLTYFREIKQQGWNSEAWATNALQSWATPENSACSGTSYPEEFWNCADISIVGGGNTAAPTPAPATPTPAPATPTPTPATPSPAGEPEPAPEPEPEPTPTPMPTPTPSSGSSTTAQKWGQCGGKLYEGPTQCVAECTCKVESEFYSQCVPTSISSSSSQPTPEPTPVPTPAPTPASTPGTSTSTADAWGKCGGANWDGPTQCVAGYHCRFQDDWYSQCWPGSSTSFLRGSLAVVKAHRHTQQ
jgi:cell division septation protein DedD